jgi:hypothetical protein
MTQFTSQLARLTTQSSEDMNDDDLKRAAKRAADNTDQEISLTAIALSLAQSGTLDSANVVQSVFAQAKVADAISNELELIFAEGSSVTRADESNLLFAVAYGK